MSTKFRNLDVWLTRSLYLRLTAGMARRPQPSVTRAHAVLERLRRDILDGVLLPGSRLGFAELGERYSVSTGVLREVLPRLVEHGLATSEPQLGFRVVTVSPEDLAELTDARVALESMITEMALKNGDIAWETALVAAHYQLSRTLQLGPDGTITQAWMDAHEAFHSTLWSGAGNRYLCSTAARLRTLSEVYRCWTREVTIEVERDVAGEHAAICEAALARDVPLSRTLIERHLRLTTELLLQTQRPRAEAR